MEESSRWWLRVRCQSVGSGGSTLRTQNSGWIYLAGRGKDAVVPHWELGLACVSGNRHAVDLLTSLLPVAPVNFSCTSGLRAGYVFAGKGRSPKPELNLELQENKRWHLPVPARLQSSWALSAQVLWILVICPELGLWALTFLLRAAPPGTPQHHGYLVPPKRSRSPRHSHYSWQIPSCVCVTFARPAPEGLHPSPLLCAKGIKLQRGVQDGVQALGTARMYPSLSVLPGRCLALSWTSPGTWWLERRRSSRRGRNKGRWGGEQKKVERLVLCQGAQLMGTGVPSCCRHLCSTVPGSALQLLPLRHGPSSVLEHEAR